MFPKVENRKQLVVEPIYNDSANDPENEQSETAHINLLLVFL